MLGCTLVLGGCATLPRLEAPQIEGSEVAPSGFPDNVRFNGLDGDAYASLISSSLRRDPRPTTPRGAVLALSGGGAGGAFGAGVIVGLTRRNDRPVYDVVSGVSTGALAAPFAYLGPSWDHQLEAAFSGGWSNHLLKPSGVTSLFSTGLYRGGPLRNLVDHFVTPELVAAVAKEAASGRLLLVATTNLDTGETVVWNMGVVAAVGGDRARALFRDILVASSSVPGALPPVMITVQHKGRSYEEMHVDGGVAIPFFVVSASQSIANRPRPDVGVDVFVIVNGPLSATPTTTPRNTIAIARRSFTALLNQTVRSELLRVAALNTGRGPDLHYTALPEGYGLAGSLEFDQAAMRRLFAFGAACAATGKIWLSTIPEPHNGKMGLTPGSDSCPAQ